MSTIALPVQFTPSTVNFKQNVNQRVSAAPFGGSEQAIDLLNDRWTCNCEISIKSAAKAASLEAFVAAMRGQTNTVALYHFARPAPNGTMRGTLTLNVAAAQGASSIVVTGGAGQAGNTLLAGDMLGVGGLLLMVASDCVADANGTVTVLITNRLRVAQNSGAAVTWSQPTALFRLLSSSGIQYTAMVANPSSFDFGEAI